MKTARDLALVRDAMGQGGIEEGLKLTKGLHVGDAGMPAGDGDLWIENSIRYSTALSAGLSVAATTITAGGGWQPISFDSEVWDTDDIADIASYPTRLMIITPGVYHVHGYVTFGASAVGYRGLNVRLNGANPISAFYMTAMAAGNLMVIDALWLLEEGDYLELCGLHNTGSICDLTNVLFSIARVP